MQAIQIAFQISSWDLLTRSLVNLAEVRLVRNETDAAKKLLLAALAHPSILYEYGLKGVELLGRIGASPPTKKDPAHLMAVLEAHFDLKLYDG